MSTPILAPPRRPSAPLAQEPHVRRVRREPVRPRHHETERRVWKWALIASVGFHVLVLLFSPLVIRIGLPPGDTDTLDSPTTGSGMRMVDPAAIPLETLPPQTRVTDPARDVPPPAAAPADRLPLPVRPDPRAPVPARPGAPRPGDAPPAENPLRPGLRDPRLWITPREAPPPREPTHEELHAEYMARLEARIRALNDSVAGDEARERRATDWTVRDRNGGRWGVSPEGIHLGGITLPPATFPPGGGDPDKRARAEEQERTRGEIDRQEADTERRRVREERIRATRERRDAEREAERNPDG